MKNRLLILAVVAAGLAACSTVPDRNSALEQARSRVNAASADTQLTLLAPEELKRASESLRVADQAWRAGDSTRQVEHLAYLAQQRLTIAQHTASSRASQAITAGAAAERDGMRLTQRGQEADLAKQQLAAAEAAAQRDKASGVAQAERRDARVSELEMQLKALNAKKTERGMVLTLGDVLFDSGQARLLAEGSRNMLKLADFFRRNPRSAASIEGHTDSVGGAEANLALSGQRAQAVMAALVGLGVPADHLNIKALGEAMPVADNGTPAGRQINRRVEIVFAPQADEVSQR